MTPQELKFELQQQCKDLIKIRYETVNKTIANIEQALRDESKGTSGDKHHTERAMLQIEREATGKQLREIEKVMLQLDKVTISDVSETIRLGSIIETNQANFFISISVGKLQVDDLPYHSKLLPRLRIAQPLKRQPVCPERPVLRALQPYTPSKYNSQI